MVVKMFSKIISGFNSSDNVLNELWPREDGSISRSWSHEPMQWFLLYLFLMQCCLRARRSLASNFDCQPGSLRKQISPDSLNILMKSSQFHVQGRHSEIIPQLVHIVFGDWWTSAHYRTLNFQLAFECFCLVFMSDFFPLPMRPLPPQTPALIVGHTWVTFKKSRSFPGMFSSFFSFLSLTWNRSRYISSSAILRPTQPLTPKPNGMEPKGFGLSQPSRSHRSGLNVNELGNVSSSWLMA